MTTVNHIEEGGTPVGVAAPVGEDHDGAQQQHSTTTVAATTTATATASGPGETEEGEGGGGEGQPPFQQLLPKGGEASSKEVYEAKKKWITTMRFKDVVVDESNPKRIGRGDNVQDTSIQSIGGVPINDLSLESLRIFCQHNKIRGYRSQNLGSTCSMILSHMAVYDELTDTFGMKPTDASASAGGKANSNRSQSLPTRNNKKDPSSKQQQSNESTDDDNKSRTANALQKMAEASHHRTTLVKQKIASQKKLRTIQTNREAVHYQSDIIDLIEKLEVQYKQAKQQVVQELMNTHDEDNDDEDDEHNNKNKTNGGTLSEDFHLLEQKVATYKRKWQEALSILDHSRIDESHTTTTTTTTTNKKNKSS